ncbi:MAG: hypothetical protein AB7S70_02520 [Hyphomicrobium sp.]|uniref:hypothetical protein n=1 Tax=Hyphomicrobium sp. TaxID=82 RepID=UPI003D0F529A
MDATAAEDCKPCLFMGVKDTVDAFVDYMMTGDIPLRLSHDRWLQQFRRWARESRVEAFPDTIFLTAFKRHPYVRKGRERAKDRNGRVIRVDTDARSPKRPVVYVLEEPRRLPGTVPVSDVVPKREVLTKKQREAARAAVAQPPEQPLPFSEAA